MTDLYYRAKSYYQYSYIWEIYKHLGGKFIQLNSERFDLLQTKVGKENCYLFPKSRVLPQKVGGLIIEMALNSKYFLERGKHFKNVLIYHGMGMDKTLKGRKFPVSRYDFYFISGDKDYQRFKHYSYGLRSFNKRIVKIGHLRSDFIINNKYKKDKTIQKLGIKDKSRKNILYAPTWSRGHGSLLKTYKKFCSLISKEHNLLIRTHPYDLKNYTIIEDFIKKNKINNVYLIDPDEIDIIENLTVADLLIGENSSVMYDWLFFNKPLILIKTSDEGLEKGKWIRKKKFQVYSCGYTYIPGENNINELISESLKKHPFAEQIQVVKENTFYFNDGKANERAIEWVKDRLQKMS